MAGTAVRCLGLLGRPLPQALLRSNGRSDARSARLGAAHAGREGQRAGLGVWVPERRSRQRSVGLRGLRASQRGQRDSASRSPSPRPSTSGASRSEPTSGSGRDSRDVSAKALAVAQREQGGLLGVMRTYRRHELRLVSVQAAKKLPIQLPWSALRCLRGLLSISLGHAETAMRTPQGCLPRLAH